MKTLHSIFHRGLLLNFAKIVVFSICTLVLGISIARMNSTNISIKLIGALSIFFCFLCPLAISFMNSSFPHNVKWLINQHFNRKTLISFFFLSQTLKVALAILAYTPLVIILTKYMPESVAKDEAAGSVLMYADVYLYSVFFLFGIYIFYVCSLFGANISEVKRDNSGQDKNMAAFLVTFAITFLIMILMPFLEEFFPIIPNVIKGYLVSFFVVFTSLVIINRTFRFYNEKRFMPLAALYGSTIIVPFVVLTLMMRYQVHDDSIPYGERSASVVHLGWINKTFSNDQMMGFLEEAPDRLTYMQLLRMFKGKIDFDRSLMAVKNEFQAVAFLSFYAEPQEEGRVKKIIDFMGMLGRDNQWDTQFIFSSSRQFFSQQSVGREFLDELASSTNSYHQLASVYFAHNSLSRSEFLEFYGNYADNFAREVTEDTFVKRTIASEPF